MTQDFLPIKGYDHIEFYVGNAKQAAHFYDMTFGFKPVAKRGLETASRERGSYIMEHGNARFVFPDSSTPESDIARFCLSQGEGAIGQRW